MNQISEGLYQSIDYTYQTPKRFRLHKCDVENVWTIQIYEYNTILKVYELKTQFAFNPNNKIELKN